MVRARVSGTTKANVSAPRVQTAYLKTNENLRAFSAPAGITEPTLRSDNDAASLTDVLKKRSGTYQRTAPPSPQAHLLIPGKPNNNWTNTHPNGIA